MSKPVLVLTSTGATGSATLRALVARGAPARAATRDPSRASTPAGVTPVRFDLDDPGTWDAALAGVDAVFLANPPFREGEVETVAALIDAARRAGVRKLVRLSASGVEAAPESTHRRIEVLVEGSGLAWTILRPTFFQDNFINFYGATIRGDGAIYLPAGGGKTGFVASDDIGEVAAAALAGGWDGEHLVLTGPESLDHAEVAATLTDVLGYAVRYVDVPPEAFAASMREHGAGEIAVATMSWLYDMVRAGWTGGLSGDVERVLGRPPVAFADWARRHASAWAR